MPVGSQPLVRSRTWHAKSPAQLRLEADNLRLEAQHDRLRHEMRADRHLLRNAQHVAVANQRIAAYNSQYLNPIGYGGYGYGAGIDPLLSSYAGHGRYGRGVLASPYVGGAGLVGTSMLGAGGLGNRRGAGIYGNTLRNGIADRRYELSVAAEQLENNLALADINRSRNRELLRVRAMEQDTLLGAGGLYGASPYLPVASPYVGSVYGGSVGTPFGYNAPYVGTPAIVGTPYVGDVGMSVVPGTGRIVPLGTPAMPVIDPVLF